MHSSASGGMSSGRLPGPAGGKVAAADAERFATLFSEHEQWLMRRTLDYARRQGYTRYTSTLEEAWRVSIVGLTQSLLNAVKARGWDLEMTVDEDLSADPAAAFGILEAERHRARGVTLAMFLGLMKYYRQSYLDLVDDAGFDATTTARYRHVARRFFDRMEIGFCDEWARLGEPEAMALLEGKNREMTNEKNKYLTTFDSIKMPVFLVDPEGAVDNMNLAAARAFAVAEVSGSSYYSRRGVGRRVDQIDDEVTRFVAGATDERSFEREIDTADGPRHFLVSLKKMLDVSGKFSGATVILTDITERKEAEEAFRTLSLRDDLTGLHNRRGFDTLGGQLIEMAHRLGKTLFMLFVDLDHLKEINDAHSHRVGDRALVDVAAVLRETFRKSDVIARLGGDEFGVLAVADPEQDADDLMRRLQERVTAFNETTRRPYELSLSAGVAPAADVAACDLDDLVARADALMYEDKQRKDGGGALRD